MIHDLIRGMNVNSFAHPLGYNFGYGLHPASFLKAAPIIRYPSIHHRHLALHGDHSGDHLAEHHGQVSTIAKDGFQVCLDVTEFEPNELQVKVLDNHIVIEGRHEEREDEHGYIMRHFKRRYRLPQGYDADKVVSTLSSDGELTVSVTVPQLEATSHGRVIHIQQTGEAHLNVKVDSNEKDEKTDCNGSNGDSSIRK